MLGRFKKLIYKLCLKILGLFFTELRPFFILQIKEQKIVVDEISNLKKNRVSDYNCPRLS